MRIHVKQYAWADGKTVWCYAWRNPEKVCSCQVDIQHARELYPRLNVEAAVKQVSKDIFKAYEENHGDR